MRVMQSLHNKLLKSNLNMVPTHSYKREERSTLHSILSYFRSISTKLNDWNQNQSGFDSYIIDENQEVTIH